jgi:hypothetical protein
MEKQIRRDVSQYVHHLRNSINNGIIHVRYAWVLHLR